MAHPSSPRRTTEDEVMNAFAFRTTRSSCGAIVAVGLCGVGGHLAAQSGPLLTLAQAVDEALLKNDRMLNQHDAIEQSALGVRLARNEFQPKVTPNILGSFGQTDVNSQN